MTPSPRLSVILPAWNAEKYLHVAVQSLLDQTFDAFELLIIDDGSTDSTAQIAQTLATTDLRIRIISNSEKRGVSAARNSGIDQAKTPLIALHDADDTSAPERLEKQIAFLKARPDIGLVSTNCTRMNENGAQKSRRPMPPYPTYASLKKRNAIITSAVMVRKSVLEKVGGFNEYFVMAEDYELWLRIVKTHRIANLPAALVQHRTHSESTTAKSPGDLVAWRMLALALADELITTADAQRYAKNGIATFAEEMPAALREAYLTHLAAGLKNAKHYKQSLTAFIEWKNYSGWNVKKAKNIVKMWMKARGK